MAGDWIPVRKGLKNELEVLRLSVLSGLPARTVVSVLIDFWEWVDSVTDDGVILGVKLDQMSHICPDVVPTFWAHLRTVGWIAEAADSLVVPNFDYWMGNSAKKRLKDARRKRHNRKVGRNVPIQSANRPNGGGTIRGPQESTGQDSKEDAKASSSAGKPPGKVRKRDDLFDAVAEVTHSDARSSGSHVGKVCASLKAAEPPYTPAEVRALPGILAARGFDLPLSLGTVEKYIGWTRQAPPAARGGRLAGLDEFVRRGEAKDGRHDP